MSTQRRDRSVVIFEYQFSRFFIRSQVSTFTFRIEFVLVQNCGHSLPLSTRIHFGFRDTNRWRSTDSREATHQRLGIAKIVGKIHIHRMEIPQQQHKSTDKGTVGHRQKGIQHRFGNARMGNLFHCIDTRCSSLLEQRATENIGSGPWQRYIVAHSAFAAAIVLVRQRLVVDSQNHRLHNDTMWSRCATRLHSV